MLNTPPAQQLQHQHQHRSSSHESYFHAQTRTTVSRRYSATLRISLKNQHPSFYSKKIVADWPWQACHFHARNTDTSHNIAHGTGGAKQLFSSEHLNSQYFCCSTRPSTPASYAAVTKGICDAQTRTVSLRHPATLRISAQNNTLNFTVKKSSPVALARTPLSR